MFPGSFTFHKVAEDLTLYYNHLQPSSTQIIFRIGGLLTVAPEELIVQRCGDEMISVRQQKRMRKMSMRLDAFMVLSHMQTIDHLLNDITRIWLPPYVYIASYRFVKGDVYERI